MLVERSNGLYFLRVGSLECELDMDCVPPIYNTVNNLPPSDTPSPIILTMNQQYRDVLYVFTGNVVRIHVTYLTRLFLPYNVSSRLDFSCLHLCYTVEIPKFEVD